jgi:solute carrier family 45 protein 1/2/4
MEARLDIQQATKLTPLLSSNSSFLLVPRASRFFRRRQKESIAPTPSYKNYNCKAHSWEGSLGTSKSVGRSYWMRTALPHEDIELDNMARSPSQEFDDAREALLTNGRARQLDIEQRSDATYIVLMTAVLCGLQFVWGVEQVFFTNYMVDIGMSKSLISLVWLAGPLTGLVVQPLAGTLSDACTSRYGRRRPFILISSVLTLLCLLIMGWARDVVYLLVRNQAWAHTLTIVSIVAAVFLLDFAVNTVAAASRALIVDCLPPDKQKIGNAWASRMVAVGHLTSYLLGYVNLRSHLWWLGESQFKICLMLAIVALASGTVVTCYSVQEQVHHDSKPIQGLLTTISKLYRTFWDLSLRTQLVCLVQVLAWHGWFPFLFYTSTWVGEVYASDRLNVDADTRSRMGSRALLLFAVVTLICSYLLPKAVKGSGEQDRAKFGLTQSKLWGISHMARCLHLHRG